MTFTGMILGFTAGIIRAIGMAHLIGMQAMVGMTHGFTAGTGHGLITDGIIRAIGTAHTTVLTEALQEQAITVV